MGACQRDDVWVVVSCVCISRQRLIVHGECAIEVAWADAVKRAPTETAERSAPDRTSGAWLTLLLIYYSIF